MCLFEDTVDLLSVPLALFFVFGKSSFSTCYVHVFLSFCKVIVADQEKKREKNENPHSLWTTRNLVPSRQTCCHCNLLPIIVSVWGLFCRAQSRLSLIVVQHRMGMIQYCRKEEHVQKTHQILEELPKKAHAYAAIILETKDNLGMTLTWNAFIIKLQ